MGSRPRVSPLAIPRTCIVAETRRREGVLAECAEIAKDAEMLRAPQAWKFQMPLHPDAASQFVSGCAAITTSLRSLLTLRSLREHIFLFLRVSAPPREPILFRSLTHGRQVPSPRQKLGPCADHRQEDHRGRRRAPWRCVEGCLRGLCYRDDGVFSAAVATRRDDRETAQGDRRLFHPDAGQDAAGKRWRQRAAAWLVNCRCR